MTHFDGVVHGRGEHATLRERGDAAEDVRYGQRVARERARRQRELVLGIVVDQSIWVPRREGSEDKAASRLGWLAREGKGRRAGRDLATDQTLTPESSLPESNAAPSCVKRRTVTAR